MNEQLKRDVFAVKRLGDAIGYGHLMALATALWRKKMSDEYGDSAKRAAFIGVCDISIKQERLDAMQAELGIYDHLIEITLGGGGG